MDRSRSRRRTDGRQSRTSLQLAQVSCCAQASPQRDVGQVVTIDVLPDDVLLSIFVFCVVGDPIYDSDDDIGHFYSASSFQGRSRNQKWILLVHVCRRWRGIIFGSPRHLNLQLLCSSETSASETLDVWPALPLQIRGDVTETSVDNIITQLKLSDRFTRIELVLNSNTTSQIEKLWTAMQVPFPELANLFLSSNDSSYVPVLPDSFLGESAPRLQHITLSSVPFPGLPKLLLSTTHLVTLWLLHIPHSGYISPEAMATCLSMLTNLETLELRFESPQSFPDQENRHSLPPTLFVLPALTDFEFKGVNEYFEKLVARIDAPRLRRFSTAFFNDIDFDTPELIRFLSRSSTFKVPNTVHVCFGSRTASVNLRRQPGSYIQHFGVIILCRESGWQLSSLAQICTTSMPLFSTTENLFIFEPEPDYQQSPIDWKEGIENVEWLELLLPFTAVNNLYLSKRFAPRIAPALQEMTEGEVTEVLSTLQNLFLEGYQPSESIEEGIVRFISARQLINRPVSISAWERAREPPVMRFELER